MKKIVWFWNFVHYSLFLFFKYCGDIITYPLFKIFNIGKVKDGYYRKGVFNPKEQVSNALNNPTYGTRMMFAGAGLNILMLLLLFGLFNLLKVLNILPKDTPIKTAIIITILIALMFNYFLIFKGDSYLDYFREFNEMKNRKRIANFALSAIICMLILSFSIYMFLLT
ncbi:hypothetical protein [Joostella sp. CR20]|uniref:hypothetical protein n=1 Tax=Joostella sp. CR20 TaxID=2804312 RepID=UPI00313D50F0